MFSFLLCRELGHAPPGNRCAKCKIFVHVVDWHKRSDSYPFFSDCYACHDCGRAYCDSRGLSCWLEHLNQVCLKEKHSFWTLMNKDPEWEEFLKKLDEQHLFIQLWYPFPPGIVRVPLCATCHIRRIERDLSG